YKNNPKVKLADNNKEDGQVLNKETKPEYLSKDVDFELFWKTWNLIKDNYVEQPVSETKLFYGAMAGMLAGLEDPYSVFFEPVTSEKFSQEISGSFEGIGAEIGLKKDQLTVIAPLDDTPAYKAGLRAGDKILAIDDFGTTGISLDQAIDLIRGKKGTEVVLTIMRDGSDEPKKISIIRGMIDIPSVRWHSVEGNEDIAYIKLSYLNEDTANDFKKTVNEILKKNSKGVILDLRNDPGGLLDVAIKIASYWVEEGVIVREQFGPNYRNSFTVDKKVEHQSMKYGKLKDIPTIILVNQGSASGSEIIAGALQDYEKAVIIGEKTFGKGSVQELEQLSDGSSVKLTIAEWFTPKGRVINKQGIEPDIKVELSEDDYNNDKDPQLDKAIEVILEKVQSLKN
ncbi:MAG: carboxyl-terminal processing protease, partial [Parcubacteria group bacterium Athens0714_12]